jgi:hypothetical protein
VRPTIAASAVTALACLAAACGGTAPRVTPTPGVPSTPSARAPGTAGSPSAATTAAPTPPPTRPSPTAPSAVSTTGPIGQSLTLSPASVRRGGTVRVSGFAPQCTGVTILSNAFPGPQEFAGVHAVTPTTTPDGHFSASVTIPVSTAPGSYPVTVRACGGNLGVELTLTVT